MKPFGFPQIAILWTSLTIACCVSCNRQASNSATAAKNTKPGPEVSFDGIMDMFRRRMEETPIGFVATNSSGRSAMTGTNKVSYELIRPTSKGEPYKAVVTVTSQSHYSILRTTETSKDESRDKANGEKSSGTLDETDPDAISLDSNSSDPAADEGSTQRKSATRPGEEKVSRQKDEEIRKYELIYEGGRWSLVTKLNDQTEKAIENAFSNALDTQN